jgi:hypothetical protein
MMHGITGVLDTGMEWVQYTAAGLISGAPRPMSIRDAIRAAAPRPVLIIAGGAVTSEPAAARWFRAASPTTVPVWVVPHAGHTAGLATAPRKPGAEHRLIPSGMGVIVAACTVIGVVTAVRGQAPIVSAESMRATMMDYRNALVHKQLAAGDPVIVVFPAPLLVYPTDARDIEFTAVQSKGWFVPGYRSYVAIPGHAAPRFVTHPRLATVPTTRA